MADDATNAMNDIDHVGFYRTGVTSATAVNFVWNLNGQSAQSTAGVHTLAADTYVSFGMKYEPGDNKVHVFVDGVENAGAAFLMSHASAPADNLAVTIALKADGDVAAGDVLTIDWVRMAVEY